MMHQRLILILFSLFTQTVCLSGQSTYTLDWQQLPDLPPPENGQQQPGLAGAFAGIHEDRLIIAGGANFPNNPPWLGGQKVWWDDIYVLQKTDSDQYIWHTNINWKLPAPLAYGVTISTTDGLLCFGGNQRDQISSKIYQISWNIVHQEIEIKTIGEMPVPMAMMTGGKIGSKVYLAGGQSPVGGKHFFEFDLEHHTWEELPSWPGKSRILPISAVQSNGTEPCFYLFSGRHPKVGQPTELLTDGFVYVPSQKKWTSLNTISPENSPPTCLMAGSAIGIGAHHILAFGGDDGTVFKAIEAVDLKIATTNDTSTQHQLVQQKEELLHNHPGFSTDVLAYHTITDQWVTIGKQPRPGRVTTPALSWGNQTVLPSGEVQPGVRTATVTTLSFQQRSSFGIGNYVVISLYLLLLIGMGIYFARRDLDTHDYFKAGGRIPWWAAGLSIFGTQLSAITFMAIPAKTYATNWTYFWLNMTILIVAPLIIWGFLPFFRRLQVTTAYEYLEKRFNVTTRLIGATMFMLLQLGRIGIVLFLPSMALSMVTGIAVTNAILVMGLLSIFYTVSGGIEAVIWTDVIQVFILLGGALGCLLLIPFNLEGGWSQLWHSAAEAGKLQIFDGRLDLTVSSFWVMLIGGVGASLISYGSDQTVIQRYMTTKDEGGAARSIWTNALLAIPATVLFFAMGTALFVFYKDQPVLLNPTIDNADAIFPFFIVTQLPDGIAGLLIAGIFAAAMSSLDSSMNAVATVLTHDFFRRFKPAVSDRQQLIFARIMTALIGLLGLTFALVLATWDIQSLWDQLNIFIGLFAGGLGGIFMLGIFTRKTNGTGAIIGLLSSAFIQYLIKTYTPLSFLLYTATGMIACIFMGYMTSLLWKVDQANLEGLTIYRVMEK